MTADLHIHTTASDGRLSPLEVIKQAEDAGLTYISITDHDTVAAHRELRASGILSNHLTKPSVIPGIEFSTDLPDHEVHILGYFIDIDNNRLSDQLAVMQSDRLRRLQTMVEKLNKLGYTIDYERVIALAGQTGAVGRPHVAHALVENGYFKTVHEVFAVLLANDGPAYVPHYKLTPKQAVNLIEQAGGIAVLAHPGLIGDDRIVIELIQSGMRGLEVYHPEHDKTMTNRYLAIAHKYRLKITGGSDFHAISGRYPEKLGIFTVSDSLVEHLSI